MDGWHTTFLLGNPIFRCKPLVSGRVVFYIFNSLSTDEVTLFQAEIEEDNPELLQDAASRELQRWVLGDRSVGLLARDLLGVPAT